jgi:hypothetical protein
MSKANLFKTVGIIHDYAGIQETVEDYNSWIKYITQAGGDAFSSSFDIFKVSQKDRNIMKSVLQEIINAGMI